VKNKWRKIGCIASASLVAFLTPIIAFVGYLFWDISHQTKLQRRDFLAAIDHPAELSKLRIWATPYFGHLRFPDDASQTLPTTFRSANHFEEVEPVYDNWGRVTTIFILYGGADDHWGLILGLSPTKPPDSPFSPTKQLGSQIWYFDH
jgi:hypothetical protein